MDLYGITPHLDRAKAYLVSDDPHQWIYAALELRFAFEAAAYRQVEAYGGVLPSSILQEWRPDQILKLLASFDERSGQSAAWSISVQPAPDHELRREELESWEFVPVGEQKGLPWRDFRKSYNALGSFLHLDKQQQHHLPVLENLAVQVAQLDEMAQATTIVTQKDFSTSTCECGEILVLGPRELSGTQLIHCPRRTCNRLYRAQPTEPDCPISQVQQIALGCPCGARVPFAPDRLLQPTTCPSCKSDVGLEVRLVVKPKEAASTAPSN